MTRSGTARRNRLTRGSSGPVTWVPSSSAMLSMLTGVACRVTRACERNAYLTVSLIHWVNQRPRHRIAATSSPTNAIPTAT